MLALLLLAFLAVAVQPTIVPSPASTNAPAGAPPPTPPPLVSPAPTSSAPASTIIPPAPTPTAAPVPTAAPSPSPAAAPPPPPPSPTLPPTPPPPETPTPTPNPYGFVVTPTPAPSGSPQILEIDLNDRVLHKGGLLMLRVLTSPDVSAVVMRTLGREVGVARTGPGLFMGDTVLPSAIPFFLLHRTYAVQFVASTPDGRNATATVDVRLDP